MKFKVGDKVRIKKDLVAGKAYGHVKCYDDMTKYGGCCATITEMYYGGLFIDLDVDHSKYTWAHSMLEPYNEFTKSDLKDGMIVEFRNGHKRLYINGIFTAYEWGWISIDEYTDDLIYPDSIYYGDTLDVVKVYKTNARLIKDMLDDPSRLELIWKRVETKKPRTPMTVEEIEDDIKKHFKETRWLVNRFKKEHQPVWIPLDEINESCGKHDKSQDCFIKWWEE